MSQTMNANDLANNPNFLLHLIDFQKGLFHFLEVTPETYRDSAFLDERLEHASGNVFSVPYADMARVAPMLRKPEKRMNFLFHSAFCGSTLLSRCLTEPGVSFTLREPQATLALANFKRTGGAAANAEFWPSFCDTTFNLLKKSYAPDEWVLVKPTNIVNNLLPEALAYSPESKVLFLYADLNDFLVSNLKKEDEAARKTILFAKNFVMDSDYRQKFPELNLDALDTAQAAIVSWHSQMYAFTEMMKHEDQNRIRTLYHEDFLTDPKTTLAAAYAFYGTPLPEERIDAIVEGPLLKTNAKHADQAYSPEQRAADKAAVQEKFQARIDAAMAWAKPMLDALPIPERLPLPLLG